MRPPTDPNEFTKLPPGLPVPADDGACDHLPGARMPSVPLRSTGGRMVDLSAEPGRVVAYIYPMTGTPGVALPEGWDAIPGARGCTPQSCAFRDHHAEIRALGATVFGVSAQSPADQAEFAGRVHLPFELLSDERLALAHSLRLPRFEAGGRTLIRRVTLILSEGKIEKVFYPVFPPNANAGEVVGWLRGRWGGCEPRVPRTF
jgi:peroxiredoxin